MCCASSDVQDRRKTEKMPRNQRSKAQNFENIARRETTVPDAN